MQRNAIASTAYFRSLFRPRAMIFGLTMFVAILAYGRWYFAHEELRLAGALYWEDHFYPPMYVFIFPPAALALWSRRVPGNLLATLLGGYLIMLLAIAPLTGYAHAFDIPLGSLANISRWLRVTLKFQPQEIYHLILALTIFSISSLSLLRAIKTFLMRLYSR